jgi:hypothetical protein
MAREEDREKRQLERLLRELKRENGDLKGNVKEYDT